MLTVDEALNRILSQAPRLPCERVSLSAAHGRVLAETIRAAGPLPAFDYSAMDGFALDREVCTGPGPWRLKVEGESQTGHPTPELVPGTACRIFTGAPIPRGANAVLLQENVLSAAAGGFTQIEFQHAVQFGEHVRRAGEDLASGDVGLPCGTYLGPRQLGLVAALDRAEVLVARAPRVFLVSTGDELRLPGSAASESRIPESNSVVLAALARAAGAEVSLAPLLADDLDRTRELLGDALNHADLVITIGGVSVGDHDFVRGALDGAGVELSFWKVLMKPGKPLAFGSRGQCRVLALPGNPMSAQITFELFGLPLLRAMQGHLAPAPVSLRLPLKGALQQKPGRRGYYAARLEADGVVPLGNKASGNTVSLALADALIVMPEELEELCSGDQVEVVLLC